MPTILRPPSFAKLFPALCALALLAPLAGCGLEDQTASEEPGVADAHDDLTSLTAVEKKVSFDSYVDLPATSTPSQIESAVRTSLRAAFGAFRTNSVGLNDRELRGNVDPRSFKTTRLTLVTGPRTADQVAYVRVSYHYEDRAVVPKNMAARSTLPLATLAPDYQSRVAELLDQGGCSDGGHEAQEFRDAAWYIFNPGTSRCQTAIGAEQRAIDLERQGLHDRTTQIGPKEAHRLFFPVVAKFTPVAAAPVKYPEYDKLWGAGSTKTTFVVQGINGQLADWADPNAVKGLDDEGYLEFLKQLKIVLAARPELTLQQAAGQDLFTFRVGSSGTYKATWADLFRWNIDRTGFPAGVTGYTAQRALLQEVFTRLFQKQLVFTAPYKVKKGTKTQTVTLELRMYYGDDGSSSERFRAAYRDADVFVYNGHSYIGHGPMDPGNFRASDFPNKYQLFVFDSCVSFNYYEKGYLDLHPGGTKNLDLVTNGLESATSDSGGSMGRLMAAIIDGTMKSYPDILKAAQFATGWGASTGDALRVVDGELDNAFTPAKSAFTVSAR